MVSVDLTRIASLKFVVSKITYARCVKAFLDLRRIFCLYVGFHPSNGLPLVESLVTSSRARAEWSEPFAWNGSCTSMR